MFSSTKNSKIPRFGNYRSKNSYLPQWRFSPFLIWRNFLEFNHCRMWFSRIYEIHYTLHQKHSQLNKLYITFKNLCCKWLTVGCNLYVNNYKSSVNNVLQHISCTNKNHAIGSNVITPIIIFKNKTCKFSYNQWC